jgi:hypothetical protein
MEHLCDLFFRLVVAAVGGATTIGMAWRPAAWNRKSISMLVIPNRGALGVQVRRCRPGDEVSGDLPRAQGSRCFALRWPRGQIGGRRAK